MTKRESHMAADGTGTTDITDTASVERSNGLKPSDPHCAYIIFGASLYWASFLLGYLHLDLPSNELWGLDKTSGIWSSLASVFDWSFFIYYGVFLAAMLIAVCFAKKFANPKAQKGLAWASAISALMNLATLVPFAWTQSLWFTVLTLAVRGIGNTCFILFWGLNFTTLNKQDAEQTAIASLGFAFTLYFAFASFMQNTTVVTAITSIMVMASLIPFLAGRYHIDVALRPDSHPDKKQLTPFYSSRAFLGVCMGFVLFACSGVETDDAQISVAASLIAFAFMLLFLLKTQHKGKIDLTYLRMAPVVSCFAAICPYLGLTSFDATLYIRANVMIWMFWMILHSVQLSALKDESGLDDASFSFTEKFVFLLTTVLTTLILGSIPSLSQTLSANPDLRLSCVIVAVFLALAVCSYQLNHVIDGKETERIVDNAFALNEQRNEPVFERIQEKYGLTPREMDVLRLLAKGFTRPAICEELCISEGTERSHARHIYQKLGVHSHDELLELIDQEARAQVTE